MPDDPNTHPSNHSHHFFSSREDFMADCNQFSRLILLYRNVEYLAKKLAPHAKSFIESLKK